MLAFKEFFRTCLFYVGLATFMAFPLSMASKSGGKSSVLVRSEFELIVQEDNSLLAKRFLNDSHTLVEVIEDYEPDGKVDIYQLREYLYPQGYSCRRSVSRQDGSEEEFQRYDSILRALRNKP